MKFTRWMFSTIHVAEIRQFRPNFSIRISANHSETKLWPKVETLTESRNSGRNYLASTMDFWPALWILCNICKGMSQVTWIYNSGRHYKFGQNYIKFRPKFRTRVSDFRIRPQFRHFLVYNELEKEKSNVKYVLQLKKINKKKCLSCP